MWLKFYFIIIYVSVLSDKILFENKFSKESLSYHISEEKISNEKN